MASKKIKEASIIVELYKRCPPNQKPQFKEFNAKNAVYKRRLNKYPEHLPKIDWEYYRKNVRSEFIKMVDEFEQKYDDLQKAFESRVNLNLSKYYVEIEQQRCEVECELKEFIAESNARIKKYEAEIKRIKEMIPYDKMTLEEFVELCPEKAELIPFGKKPLFWPFTPDEQEPGTSGDPEQESDSFKKNTKKGGSESEDKAEKPDSTEAHWRAMKPRSTHKKDIRQPKFVVQELKSSAPSSSAQKSDATPASKSEQKDDEKQKKSTQKEETQLKPMSPAVKKCKEKCKHLASDEAPTQECRADDASAKPAEQDHAETDKENECYHEPDGNKAHSKSTTPKKATDPKKGAPNDDNEKGDK